MKYVKCKNQVIQYVTFYPVFEGHQLTTFELGSHFHTPKKDTKNCQVPSSKLT